MGRKKKQLKGHVIKDIVSGSIAEELGMERGDCLLTINGEEIGDIFDYQYQMVGEYLEMLVRRPDGEELIFEIDKEEEEDIGLVFEEGLMDDYRTCCNKCIFCFIDQMPKGMRDTLYFKDDDPRLSFLQGNYVTLTNMSYEELDRVITYNLSPINISVHAATPVLRRKMLNNRNAGRILDYIFEFYEAGIEMNGQIVLCKNINDGEELDFTISELCVYIPYMESLSVVPVGLTKHREGLYPLEPFTKEDAKEVLSCIHRWQKKLYQLHGIHFVHASDEWYVMAGEELPEAERYDGYLQLENGVGMLRLLLDEFAEALAQAAKERDKYAGCGGELSIVTGKLAYSFMQDMADRMTAQFPALKIHVYAINNDFFGEQITVSGLLVGQDIINQLQGRALGERILLPQNVLRSGEDYFLDDITVGEMEKALQVRVDIVKSSGHDLVHTILNA